MKVTQDNYTDDNLSQPVKSWRDLTVQTRQAFILLLSIFLDIIRIEILMLAKSLTLEI